MFPHFPKGDSIPKIPEEFIIPKPEPQPEPEPESQPEPEPEQ
jgi:hypothetical protein